MSEVNVCRVCLTDNMYKLYRIKSISCRTFYEKLVNSKLEDGLPETFCYICYALLRKSIKFSKMAQQSQLKLTKLKNGGHKINKASLSKLDKPKLTYAVTNHDFISIENEFKPMDTFPEDVHVKEENSYYEEYLEEDIFVNDIDESDIDKNDINIKKYDIDYENDNTSDINIKINYGEEVNYGPFTGQTCAVWIKERRNNKKYDRSFNMDLNDEDSIDLEEQPCDFWIEEGTNSKINVRKDDKTNHRNVKTYERNNKANDRNDKINSKDVNFLTENPCSVWVTKGKNKKFYAMNENNYDINNKADDTNKKINDGDEVTLFMEKPRSIWTPEDFVPTQKREINEQEDETPKDPIKLNLKCYQNKRKLKKTTTQSLNENSDVSQKHRAENSMKNFYENIKLSLTQNDISSNDKSDEPVLSSSDNDISINNKTVTSSLDKAAKQSSHDKEPSLIDLSPYDLVKMDKKELGYYHCSVCDYQCLSADTFKQHIEACKIKYEFMMKRPFRVGYACKICDFQTLSLPQFNFHKNNHSDLSLYYCKTCDYRTSSQYKLKVHLTNQHKEIPKLQLPKYTCKICNIKLNTIGDLHSHIEQHKIHNVTKKFICDICKLTFRTQKSIIKHLKSHIKNKRYACDECHFVFFNRYLLKKHKNSKHKELISCKNCEFKCNTQRDLSLHIREIHENKPIQTCNICDYRCALENHMKTHIWMKHEVAYKCYKCEFESIKKKDLQSHLLIEHNEAKLYSCEKCNFKTNERASLRHHFKIHTGDCYICNVCKFKTKFKSNLAFHIKTQHTQMEKTLLCQYCGRTFKTRHSLKTHILIHVGSRTVSCNVCEFKCFKSSVLKRHMMKHSGEKPFVCDICGRRFTRRSNLNHHRGKLTCRNSAHIQ